MFRQSLDIDGEGSVRNLSINGNFYNSTLQHIIVHLETTMAGLDGGIRRGGSAKLSGTGDAKSEDRWLEIFTQYQITYCCMYLN